MADNTPVLAGGWAVFAQPDGPGTLPIYLGCHDLDDIEKDEGDITLIRCPDPQRANRWVVTGSFRGEPGPATTTITASVTRSKDILAGIALKGCGVPIYVAQAGCGKRNLFTNWESQIFALYPSIITSRGLTNVGKKDQGDQGESMRPFGISADELYEFYKPTLGRQAVTETTAIRDIVFCNDAQCAGDCGQAKDACEDGAFVTEAVSGSPSGKGDVWFKSGGGAWTVGAADPFATSEDIASIVCIQVDSETTRYIVARGTTDAAAPAEVAYTDNGGATWTLASVGTTNGQFALGPDSLMALDFNHIWLVTSTGGIYFSDDGGASWVSQGSGVVGNLWAIDMVNESTGYVVGASDVVLKTTNGSDGTNATWTATTATGGGDINQTVDALSRDMVWVGTSGGDAWRSDDGGDSWGLRAFAGSGAGSVVDIEFENDLNGWLIHNTAAPVGTLLRTVNGGYNWETVSGGGTNLGFTSIFVCDVDTAFVGGEVQGGTAYLGRAGV